MTGRWRFVLVEEQVNLPVRWQAAPPLPIHQLSPEETAATALIAATRILGRRGPGPQAWVSSYGHDPVAFMMEAVTSPVRLWSADGALVYQNTAADHWSKLRELGPPQADCLFVELDGTLFDRRVIAFGRGGDVYALEVLSPRQDNSR